LHAVERFIVLLPARAGHVLLILERMPVTLIIIVFVGMLLAFGNGANDNFKGVGALRQFMAVARRLIARH